ncbi:MAG: DUF4234 domain-containing protein [Pseudomonadota bacterium]
MEGMDSRAALEATMRQRTITDWQTGFWTAFLLSLITCGIYGLYVLYKLMDRRQQHFERMVSMRYYLIQMLREKAQAAGQLDELATEISQLEGMHLQSTNRDREGEKNPIMWLVLGIATSVTNFYVYYFLNDDFRAHEANERIFMMRASEVMQRLGITYQQIVPNMAVPERNFVTFLILTFITCGIYGVYWWYTLIEDGNNHFNNHAMWENQVYAIVSGQGEAAAGPGYQQY